jgi:hypothetical protein
MWWRRPHPAAGGVDQWRLVSCSPKSVVIKITHWIIFAEKHLDYKVEFARVENSSK